MARIDFRSVGGGASVSYGSNATQVSDANAGGASTTVSRSDHRHLGVASITASSSNTMVDPTVNLRPGNNVSFDVNTSTNTLTINAAATAGGGTSYGSNANEVGSADAPGASTSVSRADHVHAGVYEVTSSTSNSMTQRTVNLRPGANVGFGLDIPSNTLTISATGGGGGGTVSYASNSNDVGTADAAGASSLVSRADHVHKGIYEVTASSSNTLTQRTVNLRAGTGIALGVDASAANQTITITNIAGSTGGGGSSATYDTGAWNLLLTRRATANTEDDLFDAGSLAGKWAAYSGFDATVNTTDLAGWAHFTGGGAKLQAVPGGGDWTIETEVILAGNTSAGYSNSGLIVTSGSTQGSSTDVRYGIGENNAFDSFRIVFEKFVNGAYNSTVASNVVDYPGPDRMFLKIVKTSTDTLQVFWSSTGVTWIALAAASSVGFTPAYLGLVGDAGSYFNGFYRY